MRKIILSFSLALICVAMMAVPSERVRKLLTLLDGTTVFATQIGREDESLFLTDDDYVVVETDSGYRHTWLSLEDYLYVTNDRRKARRMAQSTENAPLKSFGRQRVPVILVQFSDVTFSVKEDPAELTDYYQKYCNGNMDGTLYKGHGSRGGVRDYYVQQSDSIFLPEFTVIGPVTLDNPIAYYGKNGNGTKDMYFNSMRDDAIDRAMKMYEDWTVFDNDDDTGVDMVFLIYAGLGENNGGGADAIWPKENMGSTKVNGVTFQSVAATCELRPAKKDAEGNVVMTKGDGIGVFIHEFNHSLGLPDFYDTVGYAFGMDLWSIMDYGEYGNNGYNPGGFTAYEREFLGWQKLETLKEPCTLRIPCYARGGKGYKVVNDLNENEYYVLENRQAMGWDDKVCTMGHGLQVTHVDFNATKWNTNHVNADSQHQCMTIIAANNCYLGSSTAKNLEQYKKTLSGNLYPGDTFNYDLDRTTVPANEVYSGNYMDKPICDISEEADSTITLKYCPLGTLGEPYDLTVTNVQMHSFSLSWGEVNNAQCYKVRLMRGDEVVQVYDSLSVSSLDFGSLEPGAEYRVEVRAMNDCYLNSGYASLDVTTLPDAIDLTPESERWVRVYASDGTMVSQCYEDELSRLFLHKGVYVIRPMKGPARKVFIR